MEAIRFHRRTSPPLPSQISLPEVKASLIQSFERIYESMVKAHSVYQLEGEEGDKPGAPLTLCLLSSSSRRLPGSRCFPSATLTSED